MHLVNPQSVERVAVVGAGTIGASWAAHFLRFGLEVSVWDPAPDAPERVRRFVADAWPVLMRLGLSEGASAQRLRCHGDLAAALDGVAFVQESAPEDESLKLKLFAAFDRYLPDDAVMASSTSGLLLSRLQAGRKGAQRYVLGHPFNPPHIIPVVEVLGGRETLPEVVDWTMAFYDNHGKRAVRLHKEVPGHLVNRMQAALWREAVAAVVAGVASVEDVDAAIAYGPGLRWAVMGPHQIFHLAGGSGGMRSFLEHFGPANEQWWRDLRDVSLTEEVRERLIAGIEAATGKRSVAELAGERDRLLLELLEALARSRGRPSGGGSGG